LRLFLFQREAEPIETLVPERPVPFEPLLELAERFGSERVEAALSVRAHRNEARIVEDTQVPRHAGLVNPSFPDDVTDLLLSLPKDFHDPTACGVCESLEDVNLHERTYTY
jgi:hypothetical protein